jgi:hypothetical protein
MEEERKEGDEFTIPHKHIIVLVKIKQDQERDMNISQRKYWRHVTVEMLEGDVIKNFGTQDILNSQPYDIILTHTKFIAK